MNPGLVFTVNLWKADAKASAFFLLQVVGGRVAAVFVLPLREIYKSGKSLFGECPGMGLFNLVDLYKVSLLCAMGWSSAGAGLLRGNRDTQWGYWDGANGRDRIAAIESRHTLEILKTQEEILRKSYCAASRCLRRWNLNKN